MAGRRMESAHVKPVEGWPVGQRIKCPKCGEPGVARVYTFKAKGKEYTYWVVNHKDSKCIIKRIEEPKPAAAGTAPITAFTEEVPAQAPAEVEGVEEAKPVEVPALKFAGPIPEGVDKTAWYAMVVAASWGSLRENPTEDNLRWFKNQARKVAARLGVPVEDVIPAVEAFARSPSEESKRRASEAVKFLVARILVAGTSSIESFAEEARARIEEAVRRIEEVSKVPEVRVSEMEYAVMHAVYRGKKTKEKREVAEKYGVPYGDMGEIARKAWERVFAPGRKIVVVEGQPA
jgi:hypothetical protein